MHFHRTCCFIAAIGTVLFLSVVSHLHACACCSDPGFYFLESGKPIGDLRLELIHGMTFAPEAELYLTEAGEEEVKGIASISPTNNVSAKVESKQWRLTFRAADGKTGMLALPIPAKMTALVADIHDGEKSAGGGPRLYKEWKFEGNATGDGIFQKGLSSRAHYTLIFQGRGNKCDNVEDFTQWRLEISGKNASYAFYGELANEETNHE